MVRPEETPQAEINPLDLAVAAPVAEASTKVGEVALGQAGMPSAVTGEAPVLAAGAHLVENGLDASQRVIPITRAEPLAPATAPARPVAMDKLSPAGEAINATFQAQLTARGLESKNPALAQAVQELPAAPIEVVAQPVVHEIPTAPTQSEMTDAIQEARKAALAVSAPTRVEKKEVYDLDRPVGESNALIGHAPEVPATKLPAYEVKEQATPQAWKEAIVDARIGGLNPALARNETSDALPVPQVVAPQAIEAAVQPVSSNVETKKPTAQDFYDAIDTIRSVERTADGQYVYGRPLFRAEMDGKMLKVFKLNPDGTKVGGDDGWLKEGEFKAELQKVAAISQKDLRPLMKLQPGLFAEVPPSQEAATAPTTEHQPGGEASKELPSQPPLPGKGQGVVRSLIGGVRSLFGRWVKKQTDVITDSVPNGQPTSPESVLQTQRVMVEGQQAVQPIERSIPERIRAITEPARVRLAERGLTVEDLDDAEVEKAETKARIQDTLQGLLALQQLPDERRAA